MKAVAVLQQGGCGGQRGSWAATIGGGGGRCPRAVPRLLEGDDCPHPAARVNNNQLLHKAMARVRTVTATTARAITTAAVR